MSSETYAASGRGTFADEPRLLRRMLQLDAVVSGANGVAYLAAGGLLADALDVSSTLLRVAGAVLVIFAAAVWAVAARPSISDRGVRAVVVVNVLWALESIGALAFGWLSPNAVGATWVVLQAVVVAGFAGLQAYARAPRGTRSA